jgi:hypothetical protein
MFQINKMEAKELFMRKLEMMGIVVIMMSVVILFQDVLAHAGQKSVDPVVTKAIFKDMVSGMSDESRAKITGPISDYLKITPIALAKGKETYLIEGINVPFLGANSDMFYVYEKTAKGIKCIGDLGASDGVKVLTKSHNGYRDIGSTFVQEPGKIYPSFFNGKEYRPK